MENKNVTIDDFMVEKNTAVTGGGAGIIIASQDIILSKGYIN